MVEHVSPPDASAFIWVLMNMCNVRLYFTVALTMAIVAALPAACSPDSTRATSARSQPDSSGHSDAHAVATMRGAETSPSRKSLLVTAFAVASSMPIDPHERDRARTQEAVAQACIDAGLLDQAEQCANQMAGWRRGNVIALLGQRYAALGQVDKARDCASRAVLVDVGDTTWGKDMVATEVARIYVKLGDEGKALSLVTEGQPVERGRVEAARTGNLSAAQLDAQADMFDKAIATMNFDLVRGGIDGYFAWLERVMDDAPRRARALKALSSAIPGLPLDIQVRCDVQLADALFAHGYKELAAAEMDHASKLFRATVFLPEDTAPIGVVIAKARFHMGDVNAARAELDRLRLEYEARAETIMNLRRAASLRALAEGYFLIGDAVDAAHCYKAAVDAGALNPNARPRAEDLSATCVSMALSEFVPSPELLLRIEHIRAGLVDPW